MRGQRREGRRPELLSRSHVDVVLVDPQKSENIGSCARAMANTGLGRLVLVRPRTSRPELMEAAATRLGEGILRDARIFGTLGEALAPYPVTVATTARAGSHRGDPLSPRTLARELLRPSPGGGSPPPAALVFGTERDGLSTGDLRLCSLTATIPAPSPELSSLNLAQSVLIFGYEILMAAGAEPPPPLPVLPAPAGDFERASADLESVLREIGFLPETNPGRWFMNVKKILRRAGLTRGECDLIQGISRQMRWALVNGPAQGREIFPADGGPVPDSPEGHGSAEGQSGGDPNAARGADAEGGGGRETPSPEPGRERLNGKCAGDSEGGR
ncbi:MAG: RNA methyltransferase [Deltaproteobacteria bacterium]|jgi:tRNA/rRNA methyltransferase|nr:RNA methyltransferase [Deltaproteobacteria bacterium]